MNHSSYKLTTLFFIILLLQFMGCANQNKVSQQEEFKYSVDRPIEGQLHTAKRLKTLMKEKKYEEAINLFSKKQQVDIRKVKNEDEEMFNYWCLAWALEDNAYEYYCARIKSGNGIFVFEDGVWKINEK